MNKGKTLFVNTNKNIANKELTVKDVFDILENEKKSLNKKVININLLEIMIKTIEVIESSIVAEGLKRSILNLEVNE